MWFSKTHFQPQGKTALIVGASQGIGADIAQRLYENECTVVLVARREPELKQQVARIVGLAGEKTNTKGARLIEHYVCDVADYELCLAMWAGLLARGIDPDFVFCCAGLSIPKLFGDLSGAELASGMTVNYLTAANTVHAGHRAVLAQKQPRDTFKPRHVVLFSSTVAVFPFIGYGQYAPAKAALQALSILLRHELEPYNYRVSCVYPGNFASEGYAEEQKTKPAITQKIEGPSAAISSLACCDIVLDRLAKGYDSVYTDFIGWLLASSVLGMNPRCWGLFQVLVSFFFLLIEPIANMFVFRDIHAFFREQRQ